MAASVSIDKLIASLENDLRSLSFEARRKYPPVKEAAEAGLLKLRSLVSKSDDILPALFHSSIDVVQPFLLGCDTKNPKLVILSLTAIQRLIQHEALNPQAAANVINILWHLMENNIEELKLLQTCILLITTNSIVQHNALAKAIVLCFRLYFGKDSQTANTAAAMIRQAVNAVFGRIVKQDSLGKQPLEMKTESLKQGDLSQIKSSESRDAYLLLQDLCHLVNAEPPQFLVGMTEMTRTFGLELMCTILDDFYQLFLTHPEFQFILKEKVCPLVIRLFSPSLKRGVVISQAPSHSPSERPYFPIMARLLRIISSLVNHCYSLLITECEIFLSLLVKFLENEKLLWQQALALEVLYKFCCQPEVILAFCKNYDLKEHSTKIFSNIMNGMASFTQSLFLHASSTSSTVAQPQVPENMSQAHISAFIYRGVCLPIIMNVPQSSPKLFLLDFQDRHEPPHIPDGYCISLSFSCLLECVKSLQKLIDVDTEKSADDVKLHKVAIESSWCGLLSSMSLLLDASTDELATEAILRAMQTMAQLSGKMSMQIPRDAFVTALCKASLPPQYNLLVIPQDATKVEAMQPRQTSNYDGDQVVAVAPPLVPLAQNSQSKVMVTAKNMQGMRALLNLAHCHGGMLGESWYLVLNTLQHMTWLLGLKPASGGKLRFSGESNDSPVVTTAVMSDLPVLSGMLSRLFESSQYLNDAALSDLITALCKLSKEAVDMASANNEPSLFSLAKLLETGLTNLHRVTVFWAPVTNQLLDMAKHNHSGMRRLAADVISELFLAAYARSDVQKDWGLESLVLSPIEALNKANYTDVRERQVEVIRKIIHDFGEVISKAWPIILASVGAIRNDHGDSLIRAAFQCLQLVTADFLPTLPFQYLIKLVQSTGIFASQEIDLNVSLTAVELLWNISDYLSQKHDELQKALAFEESGDVNSLWMCLYSKFGELCIDVRPAVRKSACQTLFSTITAHGDLLTTNAWQQLLWKVLFPLLDNVKQYSSTAPTEKDKRTRNAGNILIHHSRDTAYKQWAETRVLTLNGVAQVFNSKRHILSRLDDLNRAWALLLEFVEAAALCENSEVSLAALKSFSSLVNAQPYQLKEDDSAPPPDVTITRTQAKSDSVSGELQTTLFAHTWQVWLSIGSRACKSPSDPTAKVIVASQQFLAAYLEIFHGLFVYIKMRFVLSDLDRLFGVIKAVLAVPVHSSQVPFLLPAKYQPDPITDVQNAALNAIRIVEQELSSEPNNSLYADFLLNLLSLCAYAVDNPKFGKLQTIRASSVAMGTQTEYVTMNFVPFGEQCMTFLGDCYHKAASYTEVVTKNVLIAIVTTLRIPLSLKYECPSATTWPLALHILFDVLTIGIPVALQQLDPASSPLWNELMTTFEEFLFPKSLPPAELSIEQARRDEILDCKIVELIKTNILPESIHLPQPFVASVVDLLNRGSIHRTAGLLDLDAHRWMRQEFASKCFETLLQCSFVNTDTSDLPRSAYVSTLTVKSLLSRCDEVVKKYVEESRHSGKCPMPLARKGTSKTLYRIFAIIVRPRRI